MCLSSDHQYSLTHIPVIKFREIEVNFIRVRRNPFWGRMKSSSTAINILCLGLRPRLSHHLSDKVFIAFFQTFADLKSDHLSN